MQPVFTSLPAMNIAGIQTRVTLMPVSNAAEVIPPAWNAFLAKASALPPRMHARGIGVSIPLPAGTAARPREIDYIAGAEVEDLSALPEGLTGIAVPDGAYACFTHRGPMSDAMKSFEYIYQVWLPQAPRPLRHAPHIEIYDERFKMDSDDCAFDICVPVG